MLAYGFEDFQAFCGQQNVVLDPRLQNAAFNSEQTFGGKDIFGPNDMMRAINMAARLKCFSPEQAIANAPIELGGQSFRNNVAALTLVNIINAGLECEKVVPSANDLPGVKRGIDACMASDNKFTETANRILAGKGRECQIIGNDKPLLLRKGNGIASTLSLDKIRINGGNYPAGSILRLELLSDPDQYIPRPNLERAESVDIGEVRGASFVRLSALAFNLEERKYIFGDLNGCLRKIKIQDIKEIARLAFIPQTT